MSGKIDSILHSRIPGGEFENNKENILFADRNVYLTKLNLSGLKEMHEYSKLPIFYKYLEYRPHKTIDKTKEYIESLMDRISNGYHGGECMYWFIRSTSTGRVIGSIGLIDVNPRRKSAEVGLGISPKYWGKGHIYETLWILLKYCFDELKLERISALTRSDNLTVIRLFETSGFKVEGTQREALVKYNGKRYDLVLLGLLRREARLSRCYAISKLFLKN